MNTVLSYFKDTYKFNDKATIKASGKDENGYFIILDQTVFYPQGGGQPSDRGLIEIGGIVIPIHIVKFVANDVKHYTDQNYSHLVGQTGICSIDQEMRLLHAKLHTSGHLISNIIEKLYPDWRAVKGHHFPDQCYVEFLSENEDSNNIISNEIVNDKIKQALEKDDLLTAFEVSGSKLEELCPNLTYSIPNNQSARIVRIGDFPFSPCGGTHVKSLRELKGLQVTKYKIKNNIMKINYQLAQD